jgi:hypothetical protein
VGKSFSNGAAFDEADPDHPEVAESREHYLKPGRI